MKIFGSILKSVSGIWFASFVCTIVFGSLIIANVQTNENISIQPIDTVYENYRHYYIPGETTENLEIVIFSTTRTHETHVKLLLIIALVSNEAYDNWNQSLSPINSSALDLFGGYEPRVYEVETANIHRSFETSSDWHLIIWNISDSEPVNVFVTIGKVPPVFIILFLAFASICAITISILFILIPISIVVTIVEFFTREDRKKRLAYYDQISTKKDQKTTPKSVTKKEVEKPVIQEKTTRQEEKPKKATSSTISKEKPYSHTFVERVSKIYDTMNFQEMVLFGIAIAFLILGFVLGITVNWIIFGPLTFVSIILAIISFALFNERQKLQRNLVSLVVLHGQIYLDDASQLLGTSNHRLVNAYLDVSYSNEGALIFDASSSLFIAGNSITKTYVETARQQPSSASNNQSNKQNSRSTSDGVIVCSYCGFENKPKAVFCASCGASQTK